MGGPPYRAPDGTELEPCSGRPDGVHRWETVFPGVTTCLGCKMVVCPVCEIAFEDSGQADVPCPRCGELPVDQAMG